MTCRLAPVSPVAGVLRVYLCPDVGLESAMHLPKRPSCRLGGRVDARRSE